MLMIQFSCEFSWLVCISIWKCVVSSLGFVKSMRHWTACAANQKMFSKLHWDELFLSNPQMLPHKSPETLVFSKIDSKWNIIMCHPSLGTAGIGKHLSSLGLTMVHHTQWQLRAGQSSQVGQHNINQSVLCFSLDLTLTQVKKCSMQTKTRQFLLPHKCVASLGHHGTSERHPIPFSQRTCVVTEIFANQPIDFQPCCEPFWAVWIWKSDHDIVNHTQLLWSWVAWHWCDLICSCWCDTGWPLLSLHFCLWCVFSQSFLWILWRQSHKRSKKKDETSQPTKCRPHPKMPYSFLFNVMTQWRHMSLSGSVGRFVHQFVNQSVHPPFGPSPSTATKN